MLDISTNHCSFGTVEKISHLECSGHSSPATPVFGHTNQAKGIKCTPGLRDNYQISRTLFAIPDDKQSCFTHNDSSSQSESFSLTLPTPRHACGSSDSVLRKSSVSPVSRMSRIFTELSTDALDSLVVDPPLVEYLARHRAISEDSVRDILSSDQCKRGPKLLSAIGLPQIDSSSHKSNCNLSYAPPPGLALLLNALRQTGHHELASYLDFSRRITPASKSVQGDSDSGKSSCAPRRRGQLTLWVQLVAIKVSPVIYKCLDLQSSSDKTSCFNTTTSSCTTINNTTTTTNTPMYRYNGLMDHANHVEPSTQRYSPMLPSFVEALKDNDDMETKPKRLKTKSSHQPKKSLTNSMWIDHEDSSEQLVKTDREHAKQQEHSQPTDHHPTSNPKPKSRTFLCCFRRRPKKNKHKITKTADTHSSSGSLSIDPPHSSIQTPDFPLHGAGDSCLPSQQQLVSTTESCDSTRLALLDAKSDEFYKVLVNPDTPIHDAVVKYMEQSSGVLVLDCKLSPFVKSSSYPMTSNSSIVCIVIVATQTELIKRLSEACTISSSTTTTTTNDPCLPGGQNPIPTSKLSNDLVNVLIKAGILDHLQLQNLRLSVWLDPDEVDLAIEELMDLTE